jgi:septal ring factor EnvC (AmiA/AmiB activator)
MKKKGLMALAAALLLLFASSQDKLREINLKIADIQTKLQASKRDKSSLLNDIYALELQAESAVIELHKAELLIAEAGARAAGKEREEKALQERIRVSRDKVRRVLRVLYKMGELGYAKLFLNIDSVDQLFRNYRLIVALMDDKMTEIRVIRHDIARLQLVRAEMQAELGKLEGLKSAKAGKLAQLKALKREKLDMISRINRQRDLNTRLLEELKRESDNLTSILGRKSAPKKGDAIDLGSRRGRLPWPLRGAVISSFGKKKSSKFDTYTMNNGIEIRPERSDEIRAVGEGEIIFSDYFKGYGNLIIIQHANNFHTLYGHCDRFLKKTGDRVAKGETIAVAGSSGSFYGKALYFEIRQSLKPQDPLLWLGKR